MENNTGKRLTAEDAGFIKSHPLATAIIAVHLIVAGMWLLGFFDAALSVNKGMNLWDYSQKKNSMNFISRSGMDFYLDNFTDFGNRQRELQNIFDKWSFE